MDEKDEVFDCVSDSHSHVDFTIENVKDLFQEKTVYICSTQDQFPKNS